jgi:hypothetical protein
MLNNSNIKNFRCTLVKLIDNIESNAVGIKSLSGSYDLKVEDKAGYIITISCEFAGEDNYVNCLDKTLEKKTKRSTL